MMGWLNLHFFKIKWYLKDLTETNNGNQGFFYVKKEKYIVFVLVFKDKLLMFFTVIFLFGQNVKRDNRGQGCFFKKS